MLLNITVGYKKVDTRLSCCSNPPSGSLCAITANTQGCEYPMIGFFDIYRAGIKIALDLCSGESFIPLSGGLNTAKIEKAFELCKRMNISSPHLLVSNIVTIFAGEEDFS